MRQLLIATMLLAACNPNPSKKQDVAPADGPSSIHTLQPVEAPKEKLAWRTDVTFAKLQEEAKAQHKPVLVDVYATWCGPCKEMDRDVYSRQDVADSASK